MADGDGLDALRDLARRTERPQPSPWEQARDGVIYETVNASREILESMDLHVDVQRTNREVLLTLTPVKGYGTEVEELDDANQRQLRFRPDDLSQVAAEAVRPKDRKVTPLWTGPARDYLPSTVGGLITKVASAALGNDG